MDSIPSGRQLVICCDGTNNNLTGNTNDTNVVKLAQLLAQSSVTDASQMVFYDPGVGNPGELPGALVKCHNPVAFAAARDDHQVVHDHW